MKKTLDLVENTRVAPLATLICSKASICLPHKNLRANVTSYTDLLGRLQCGLNIMIT